jgi:hypothetical protein
MAYAKRFKKRTTVRRSAKKSTSLVSTIKRVAKQTALKLCETKKHLHTTNGSIQLYDNVTRLCISNCIDMTQGTDEQGMVGTECIVSGISLKLQFRYNNNVAPYFKLWVIEANESQISSLIPIHNGLISNAMLDGLKNQFKVLKCIVVNPMLRGLSNDTHIPWIFRTIWLPLKKKIQYRTDGVNNSTGKNIAVYCCAYVDSNPLAQVGEMVCYSTIYYKDP